MSRGFLSAVLGFAAISYIQHAHAAPEVDEYFLPSSSPVFVPSTGTPENAPAELQSLLRLDIPLSAQPSRAASSSMRLTAIRMAATSIAAQRGLYWRAGDLRRQIVDQGRLFDDTYDSAIKATMIKYRDYYIVPPVISGTEGGMRRDDEGRVLRIAEQTFRIERDPYFVVNPPSWRDYLQVSNTEPTKRISKYLLPVNSEERKIWEEATIQGWEAGVRQADSIMMTQIARLTRDIVGMVRYHILRLRKMVSSPQVSLRYLPVSGGGREMSIQDSIIRITSDPELNAQRNSWTPLPELPDTRKLFPAAYLGLRGSSYE